MRMLHFLIWKLGMIRVAEESWLVRLYPVLQDDQQNFRVENFNTASSGQEIERKSGRNQVVRLRSTDCGLITVLETKPYIEVWISNVYFCVHCNLITLSCSQDNGIKCSTPILNLFAS